jgi:hypothetical protein
LVAATNEKNMRTPYQRARAIRILGYGFAWMAFWLSAEYVLDALPAHAANDHGGLIWWARWRASDLTHIIPFFQLFTLFFPGKKVEKPARPTAEAASVEYYVTAIWIVLVASFLLLLIPWAFQEIPPLSTLPDRASLVSASQLLAAKTFAIGYAGQYVCVHLLAQITALVLARSPSVAAVRLASEASMGSARAREDVDSDECIRHLDAGGECFRTGGPALVAPTEVIAGRGSAIGR